MLVWSSSQGLAATRAAACEDVAMIDITGRVFGRLTAVRFSHRDVWRKALWLCSCSCGMPWTVRRGDLLAGMTRSCGCLRADVSTSLMHDVLSRRRADARKIR